ncbi:hypothetical protein F1735_32945 [Massilia sp. CCM 8694]|uniref:PH domain-containing protein n=1 Tax=Massilia genomosp. 1 TaxID=2609280 RepID=A0ABX0N304_9BURK|nr:hypothetical protein [Massilia genomosp. 1]
MKNRALLMSASSEKSFCNWLYGLQTKFVSRKFLETCEDLNVKFRAVPLKFVVRKKRVEKEYFMFLPVDHLPLLNKDSSTFSEARNVDSGELLMNKIYPDQVIYNNITKFVTSNSEFPHLFKCTEILQLVCTREFMQLATERNLKCIDFIPIDGDFKYDAWGVSTRSANKV